VATLTDVLEFWFGSAKSDLEVLAEKNKLWFGKDPQTDQQIRSTFAGLAQLAVSGSPDSAGLSPQRAQLARIILLDQFTRNIYRDTPQAFSADPLALQVALDGIGAGDDRQLRPIERVFYYLPLEHSEDPELQDRSVELFQRLQIDIPPEWRAGFVGFVDYALRHQVIIARFGRFPHRNAILGRESTADEVEFLKQPNSSF
jgi:uncharacterized protein (DUF924 family)